MLKFKADFCSVCKMWYNEMCGFYPYLSLSIDIIDLEIFKLYKNTMDRQTYNHFGHYSSTGIK